MAQENPAGRGPEQTTSRTEHEPDIASVRTELIEGLYSQTVATEEMDEQTREFTPSELMAVLALYEVKLRNEGLLIDDLNDQRPSRSSQTERLASMGSSDHLKVGAGDEGGDGSLIRLMRHPGRELTPEEVAADSAVTEAEEEEFQADLKRIEDAERWASIESRDVIL